MSRPRVDREDELNLLQRLVDGQTPIRIALIQAESGMGKSELVREFVSRLLPRQLTYVVIDFKGGGLSLADVFFHLGDTLGWKQFPTLTTSIQRLAQPTTVNITGNVQIGQNEISVALYAPDEQTRDARRADLTNGLIIDLRRLERGVLIFDVFEKCDPTLQPWFASVFLPAIHRSPNLTVIIAGQITPEQTQMWECEHLTLPGIAPEHWQEYANAVGATVTLDFIRGCCVALKGRCINIAQVLEAQGGNRP